MTIYTFYGDGNHRSTDRKEEAPEHPEPYIASERLRRAVNLAIQLRRPLLLEGEVGCGKSRLADAVADELGLPLYRWLVRSTTKAQEGLYTYDAIGRLHDAQVRHLLPQLPAQTADAIIEQPRNPAEPKDYRRFGAIGKAFEISQNHDYPAVVLIDEIDKGNYDFPNDLLTILDHPWEFFIPETNERIKGNRYNLPIVFITSNREKPLPHAFIRRCISTVIHLQSDPEDLKHVVVQHYKAREKDPRYNREKLDPLDEELLTKAIKDLLEVRESTMVEKKPGISELLDWVSILHDPGPHGTPAPDEVLIKDAEDRERYIGTA